MNYTIIGKQIRATRRARGLSQEELAERVDISTTHMSHIETGSTKLSLPVLVDIATVLNVRVDELLQPNSETNDAIAQEIVASLKGCTLPQAKVIAKIVKAARASMEEYL